MLVYAHIGRLKITTFLEIMMLQPFTKTKIHRFYNTLAFRKLVQNEHFFINSTLCLLVCACGVYRDMVTFGFLFKFNGAPTFELC